LSQIRSRQRRGWTGVHDQRCSPARVQE
jgi:hypothetical protein